MVISVLDLKEICTVLGRSVEVRVPFWGVTTKSEATSGREVPLTFSKVKLIENQHFLIKYFIQLN